MADRSKTSSPTGHSDEVEISALTPHIAPIHFPTMQIVGYAMSLALTLLAFAMTAHHWLSPRGLVTVLVILAFIQAGMQLLIFMHLREGRGTLWHIPVLGLALFVALGVVGFSIWIMLFKSGVS